MLDPNAGEYYCPTCRLSVEEAVDYSDVLFVKIGEDSMKTREVASLTAVNKGLGSANPDIPAFNNLKKAHVLHEYADNTERNFAAALNSLKISWAALCAPATAKVRSAQIYRRIIRLNAHK